MVGFVCFGNMKKKVSSEDVKKYLPLVRHIIEKRKKIWDFCDEIWEDIATDANWAVVLAYEDFDASKKVKFMTHVYKYVKTEIDTKLRSMYRYGKRFGKSLDSTVDEKKRYDFVSFKVSSSYKILEREEFKGIFSKALESLDLLDRAILNGYLEGMTDKEIGRILGMERAYVENIRRVRARKNLKMALWERGVDRRYFEDK